MTTDPSTSLGARVAELDKALAVHLAECTEQNKAVQAALEGLTKVVWWAATGVIAGQFAAIGFLIHTILKGGKL